MTGHAHGSGGQRPGKQEARVISLDEYRRKRDLSASGEPSGGRRRGHRPRFVVQLHDASTEHYDFRLEVDGVLKSWAVPRGPSADPRQKRLAVATEDHPLDYANFEGLIEPGNYGAGKVIVWDRGYYLSRGGDKRDAPIAPGEAIHDGHISFELHGKKLHGGYSLTRMGGRGSDQWLLVKAADKYADARLNLERSRPESVKSGKRIGQVAQRHTGRPGKAR